MIAPRRLPVLLIPLICAGLLLLAGCSGKPKRSAPGTTNIRPIGATAQSDTAVDRGAVVHLPSGKKRRPGETFDEVHHDGHAYVHRGVAYVPSGHRQRGVASWYGKKFHGRRTACGETFNMHGDTAAHKTLPMHTRVLVRNLDNGRSTVVRINDRGPYVRGRIIDLSYAKARELGFVHKGKARVELVALKPAGKAEHAAHAPKTIRAADRRPSATIPRLRPGNTKRRAR